MVPLVVQRVVAFLQRRSRAWMIATSIFLLLVIGLADYVTGFERSFLVFYVLPVSLATLFISPRFAIGLCIVATAVWLAADIAAGAKYSSVSVVFWNAGVAGAFFLIVVGLLSSLSAVLRDLEERVRRRTADLHQEMEARRKLEKEITEAADRERNRIGHELHDSVCQHLTATSLALQVLTGKLATDSPGHSHDSERATQMVEEAIELTKDIARGLIPFPLEAEGLSAALHELAHETSHNYHVDCKFESQTTRPLTNAAVATHLYSIAQEAVVNAVKHGHVSKVRIGLRENDVRLKLEVVDDGVGLARSASRERGLGLRIMRERAEMIGGTLRVSDMPDGGAIVSCELSLLRSDDGKEQHG